MNTQALHRHAFRRSRLDETAGTATHVQVSDLAVSGQVGSEEGNGTPRVVVTTTAIDGASSASAGDVLCRVMNVVGLAGLQRLLSISWSLVLLLMVWRGPGQTRGANQCELRGCPPHKPGYINMHVLSHSHMDVGWLQTVDEIYRTSQLQFVGGGWVQNDEAVTHYTTIIDQMTLGLRFLNDTFGPQCGVPSVAWQADPFGHSVSQASLFARMGFSSLMIGRISLELKENWTISRSLEFVWQADPPRQGKSIRSLKSTQMAHPPLRRQHNPTQSSQAPPVPTQPNLN
ncbi:hypothetical protein HPB51_012201 [Rhipicephalus microplus]|uniref:Glycoside hydrolase family 38 N-terminal domain-containing protein n=1 Tax=Rhipicephalus microplus TaxID=6941 RepID=A0A9J6E9U4_RHIMP|nr:hypothetical protein HPB51_012201 [Rhipicephalus microplus]